MAGKGEGLAFLCMTVIGIGYLFPISAVWAAFDYWKVLFPDINIEFVVTGVYQTGSMFTVIFLMLAKSFSLGPRILGGFCGQFVCLAIIFAFRWLPVTRDALFYLLLVVILFCSVATGYLDSAVLSLCSQYSPRMQQFLQIGIGLGTLVSVLYRDTTKLLMSGRGLADATSMYFAAALATVLICVACYRLLMSLPVSKAVLAGEVTTWNSPPPLACNFASPTPGGRLRTDSSNRAKSLLEAEQQEVANDEALADFTTVWPRVRINQSVAFLNLFLTTLCYPGLITSIPCRQFTALRAEHWFQTLLLTAFALADIVGRFLTDERLGRAGLHYGNIWMTVVVRATLFPAMLFCIASPNASDGLAVAVVAAFGLLNGFCVSLALMVMNDIPELSAEQRKTCGRISACSVNSGLCVGSLAAAVLAIALGLGS
mmetsp:Transcript_103468/g.297240  ORF Transcript_103468/g.297240 Transcript_103468/m.297240 type:complete len:428 (+) Transcript_103468:61-1344(+)|eukprot:CAMPEP_0177197250 /NCGR_PEP_ID=MMETSP0367-20130122/24474_1 /TAXON_ID=447022 ORGANISM="Scrippsiella hangoei-like, Strain SHHI-4" /NCGR_SAMPLE_ID=MMETSP0367 /ASSEMBLY_ACC=CAM_ASM_000362 /LENGTH=427 /DNA_ID=CAMNT_0018645387 /DNA_START=24 /DNA_END=1307 /DNA_ORIENTATION=-